MELLNVTAVIVTRGDVDLEPIFESLPVEWERAIWDNGKRELRRFREGSFDSWFSGNEHTGPLQDLSVYGRYAALTHLDPDHSELVYVQDDDVIVSDPQAIVDAWEPGHVVCNMPQEFRPHYLDSALVGFGACFERDLPAQAFQRFLSSHEPVPDLKIGDWTITGSHNGLVPKWRFPDLRFPLFARECDTVFTTLTPRILVDVPKTDREFASDPDRLWKQPDHVEQRQRMLELARQVRDSVSA